MTPEEIETLWKVGCLVFAAGCMYAELRAIRKDIARLEEKQDRYNHLQERMVRVEDSSKSAHKRLDVLEGYELGRTRE